MLTNDQEQLLVSRERELHELKRQLSKMMDHVTETSLHPHSRAFTQYLKVESIGTMKEAIDDGVSGLGSARLDSKTNPGRKKGKRKPEAVLLGPETPEAGTAAVNLLTRDVKSAQVELTAALKTRDAVRIKKAVTAAADAVASVHARSQAKEKRSSAPITIQGGGMLNSPTSTTKPGMPVNDQEKKYLAFHDMARDRKHALTARGLEVSSVFVDDLYDLAVDAVPYNEWREFIRTQIPSPRVRSE